jgi:cytolysin (calcineurin-like family phosphatase)
MIGDPQINIPRWGTAGLEGTIEVMNNLPGKPFPHGGAVDEPLGVIIAGDLVDDIGNPANWKLYKTFFHPNGNARLRFPVYEGAGNHDLSTEQEEGTWTYVQMELRDRNGERPGSFFFDEHRYHYSWDWGDYHFVNLNLFPGRVPRPVYDNPSPWNDPKGSLDFLEADLASQVGTSGRPVVLLWHYGLRGWGLEKWWVPEDLDALREVLDPYNVALILHGHEHRYERYTWEGYDVIMAPAPQLDRQEEEEESRPKGFLVVRVSPGRIETAHHGPLGWEETWAKTVEVPPTRE